MEEIQDIKKRIFNKNSEELHISRVPKGTAELFKEFAKSDFCDDRGMALKYLCDELLIKPPIYLRLQDQVYKLFEEFEELKNLIKQDENKTKVEENNNKIIRTNDGSRMIRKEKGE
jgi:hypothetical protein